MAAEQPQFHTIRELMKCLRIGEPQAYAAVGSGQVRAVKIGGSWRIPHSEFERLSRGCAELDEPSDLQTKTDPADHPPDTDFRETIAEDRFYRRVARLHALGARVTAELLREIAAETMQRTAIEAKIERYVERLERFDPATLAILGADKLPPTPFHAVPRSGHDAAS